MTIAIIGAGRFAHSFVPAIYKTGKYTIFLTATKKKSCSSLVKTYPQIQYFSGYNKLPSDVQAVFLAVPDDALKTVANDLLNSGNQLKDKFAIHFSGSLDSSEIGVLKNIGMRIGSLHIMQTFPQRKPYPLDGLPAGLESPDVYCIKFLKNLCREMHLNPFVIRAENKMLYHIAGVFLSNFLVGNFSHAEKLLESAGIKKSDVKKIFRPILLSTIENLLNNGAMHSLSGPVARGDEKLIAKHKALLKEKMPDLLRSYIQQTETLRKLKR